MALLLNLGCVDLVPYSCIATELMSVLLQTTNQAIQEMGGKHMEECSQMINNLICPGVWSGKCLVHLVYK